MSGEVDGVKRGENERRVEGRWGRVDVDVAMEEKGERGERRDEAR